MKKFFCFMAGILLTLSITTFAASTVFTDENTFEDWYKDAVINMYNKGIITGYPDGSFQASNNVSRAELAVMMDRQTTLIKNGCIYVEEREHLGLGGDLFFLDGDIVYQGDQDYYYCFKGKINQSETWDHIL